MFAAFPRRGGSSKTRRKWSSVINSPSRSTSPRLTASTKPITAAKAGSRVSGTAARSAAAQVEVVAVVGWTTTALPPAAAGPLRGVELAECFRLGGFHDRLGVGEHTLDHVGVAFRLVLDRRV